MKSKKSKKPKKIKQKLSQKVDSKSKHAEMTVLVLICFLFVEIYFLGSGKLLYNYGPKEERDALNSMPETQIVMSAIAAGNQTDKNTSDAESNELLKESISPEVTLEEINLAKDQAAKEARVKIIAGQQAAKLALINSARFLQGGPTNFLVDCGFAPLKANIHRGAARPISMKIAVLTIMNILILIAIIRLKRWQF